MSAGFNVTLSPPPRPGGDQRAGPAQDFSGQPMNLSWTVANIGAGPTLTAVSWTDAVYMSPDPTLDSQRHAARYVRDPRGTGGRRQLHVHANRHSAGGRERLVSISWSRRT